MPSDRLRVYKGWVIDGVGGFCTIRHFWARHGSRSFWRFRLRDVKETIDRIEGDPSEYERIPKLYREALYN